MKCQSCGKNIANVKYYENINGKKQTLYFCEACANKMGISSFSNITEIFSPIFTDIPKLNILENRQCRKCGYTLDEYLNTGMLGCENCYNTFENTIEELIYKINGKKRHIKIDKSNTNKLIINNNDKIKDKISRLKEKIEKLVKEEKYEEAAIVRDEIKSLELNSEE